LITFKVEIEREDDGRWLAEVVELPGVLAYGDTEHAALPRVQALALRVIAEQLEHGEAGPDLLSMSFRASGSGSRRCCYSDDRPSRVHAP
jgi:predicted RNase H-like HicB family nuclease